jgi:hypothetical protein
MISNLAEAGFETNFTSIYWAYASGFPKAHNLSKVIGRQERGFNAGNFAVYSKEKPEVGVPDGSGYMVIDYIKGISVPAEEKKNGTGGISRDAVAVRQVPAWIPVYKIKNPLKGAYAGFQPKPAVEIIISAMKPLSEGTYLEQALKNGKGITWLDDCRIPYADQTDFDACDHKQKSFHGAKNIGSVNVGKVTFLNGDIKVLLPEAAPTGRFPANL